MHFWRWCALKLAVFFVLPRPRPPLRRCNDSTQTDGHVVGHEHDGGGPFAESGIEQGGVPSAAELHSVVRGLDELRGRRGVFVLRTGPRRGRSWFVREKEPAEVFQVGRGVGASNASVAWRRTRRSCGVERVRRLRGVERVGCAASNVSIARRRTRRLRQPRNIGSRGCFTLLLSLPNNF